MYKISFVLIVIFFSFSSFAESSNLIQLVAPNSMFFREKEIERNSKKEKMMADYRKVFEVTDKNNDGQLTFDEMTEYYRTYTRKELLLYVETIISRYDSNGDKVLLRSEYANGKNSDASKDPRITDQIREGVVRSANAEFDAWDQDKNQQCTSEEMLKLQDSAQMDLLKNEFSAMDTDKNGFANWEEYRVVKEEFVRGGLNYPVPTIQR